MEVVHEASKERHWLTRVLTTDFCPWANRFVYWLKEPVGWFALATAISVIIGMYFAPIGWTLAALLAAVMAVGMVWPWIAVRAVACSLSAETRHVHEQDECHLKFMVRNRLPLPIWGLAVEGFLDRHSEDESSVTIPTVALAYVHIFSECIYRFSIKPELRGRYPDGGAAITCSFPFGIWTARHQLKDISPVTVWPKVFPIEGQTAMLGRSPSSQGEGRRRGRSGEFTGLREYRQGDCSRQVNWVATARTDSLIVTERSGPQCPSLLVIVDTSGGASQSAIADRVRVAASVVANLHNASIPLRIVLGNRIVVPRYGHEGFVQMMDALSDVPLDGDDSNCPLAPSGIASITISSDANGDPKIQMIDPVSNQRKKEDEQHRIVNRANDIAPQLATFWKEVRDANFVA